MTILHCSAPMLGINCARSCPDSTSGSYFRKLLSHTGRNDRQREGLMMLDFTKNGKSYDHIPDDKDKKTLSIERFKNTFSKHRSSSSKMKKRVSESDALSTSSRGGGIEIPNVHGDYSMLDFNPSPRSNNSNTSNTSTNSDVPLAGYLPMRPGASLSFSSTCSGDYVEMPGVGSIVSSSVGCDGDYFVMSPPTTSIDSLCSVPSSAATNTCDGYVDMTQGSVGLSISADSSSSSSSLNSRPRKVSSTFSHLSSMELPSPQEELSEPSYLHEVDIKTQHKEKKKSLRKSGGKRKKSDPATGDSVTETLKTKGSGHLASISSFLTRKNSQSSSTRTPLSPTGSPLPKSSRNSSSPFASLGRSKNKDSRESPSLVMSQSPSPSISGTPGSFNIMASSFSGSSSSQMSPGNLHGFIHTLNPSFRECDSQEHNSCAMDHCGTFPRNHSNRELTSHGVSEMSKQGSRSSGSYDLSSSALSGVGSSYSSCHGQLGGDSQVRTHISSELKDRGNLATTDEVDSSSYVNFCSGSESCSANTFTNNRNTCATSACQQCSNRRNIPRDHLGEINGGSKPSTDLGRVSESSLEDGKNSDGSPTSAQESTASYVNMCPGSSISPLSSTSSVPTPATNCVSSQTRWSAMHCNEEKVLNTDQNNRYSSISDDSDYLQMDMRRTSFTSNPPTCQIPTIVSLSTSASNVVKRPALPPLLLHGSRTDPSVPLEKLSLAEKSSCSSGTCCATGDSHACGSLNERCRSHSGPGAPEATRSRHDPVGLDVCEEARKGEGESRALSACSSPVSYSPPTSPSLASSSKSSLSEGGMSSASSTCTVVNVGLRLQQQQRQSHGSGSSTSNNNADTLSSSSASTPNPICSSIISISSSSSITSQIKSMSTSQSVSGDVPSPALRATSSSSVENSYAGLAASTKRPSDDAMYACLDFVPSKMLAVQQHVSSKSVTSAFPQVAASCATAASSASVVTSQSECLQDDKTSESPSPSNYTEIDFNKSERLRNACLLRDTFRH